MSGLEWKREYALSVKSISFLQLSDFFGIITRVGMIWYKGELHIVNGHTGFGELLTQFLSDSVTLIQSLGYFPIQQR